MTRDYEDLLSEREWSLVEDLTENVSGEATPVLWVLADGRDAILRMRVDPQAAEAYRGFSGSGTTPTLIEEGTHNKQPWLLLERMLGRPVIDPSQKSGDPEQVSANTDRVIRAVLALPVTPAHATHLEAAFAQMTSLELWAVQVMRRADAASCVRIAQETWPAARLLVGDLLPVNVLLHGEQTSFIDLVGGWGPVEADVGRWMVAACMMELHAAPSAGEAVTAVATKLDRALVVHPSLGRTALYGWTAIQLTRYGQAMVKFKNDADAGRAFVQIAGALEAHGRSSATAKPGRNERCICGSGQKFKLCLHVTS